MSEQAPVPRLRDELSVKLRAAEHGDLAELVAEMRRHRDIHTEQLALYRALTERDHPDRSATSGRGLHQYLVLRGGICIEEGLVDALDEVIVALES